MSKYFLVLLILLFPTMAHAGWSGNGGDQTKDQDNPWFLATDSDEAVEYCVISRIGDFHYEYDERRLRALVRDSLEKWQYFFQRYKMDNRWLGENPRQFQFHDRRPRRLALNFREVSTCDHPESQLQILFGTRNDAINAYLESTDHHLLGVALRGKYNHETYRTGGIIWISPLTGDKKSWIKGENYLAHQLLHELGHVFGMKHNSVFVMDEKIADFLTSGWQLNDKNIWAEDKLGKIELSSWPYKMMPGQTINLMEGNTPEGEKPWEDTERNSRLPDSFRKLLGMGVGDNFFFKFGLTLQPKPAEESAYQVKLEITQFERTPTGGSGKFWDFESVGFQSIFRPETQYAGYWTSAEYRTLGVYTNWHDPFDSKRYQAFFQPLGQDPLLGDACPLPLSGALKYEGNVFPVTIDRAERGLIFRMMAPPYGQWIEIVSPYFVNQVGPKWR